MQRHAANLIKIAAVTTAIPRWVVALLSAEGLIMPAAWHDWWIVFSALSAVGMAIVEGVAFAYVFNAWRNCKQVGQGRILVGLAAFSALLFVALLTPSIAANVRGLTLGAWITSDAALSAWSGIVAASTISIVASIGYAEKTRQTTDVPVRKTFADTPADTPPVQITLPDVQKLAAPAPNKSYQCATCGEAFEKSQQFSAHMRWKHPAPVEVPHETR